MEELKSIMEKFAESGWDLIAVPARQWLAGKQMDRAVLVSAIKQADEQCGNCGCELDPFIVKHRAQGILILCVQCFLFLL